jgi:hypothetical protein
LYAKFVPYLDGPNPFDSAIAAINELPSSDLLEVTADGCASSASFMPKVYKTGPNYIVMKFIHVIMLPA